MKLFSLISVFVEISAHDMIFFVPAGDIFLSLNAEVNGLICLDNSLLIYYVNPISSMDESLPHPLRLIQNFLSSENEALSQALASYLVRIDQMTSLEQ